MIKIVRVFLILFFISNLIGAKNVGSISRDRLAINIKSKERISSPEKSRWKIEEKEDSLHADGTGQAIISLSSEMVKEGNYSFKCSGTMDKKAEGGGLYWCYDFFEPKDLTKYNLASFWIYPEMEDDTYAIDLRLWANGSVQHIGIINPLNAPNKKWTKLTFSLENLNRDKVKRAFEFVCWKDAREWSDGEKIRFYVDDFQFLQKEMAKNGLIVNGGFEEGLFGWNLERYDPFTKVEVTERTPGNNCLRISYQGPFYYASLYQSIDKIEGGKWYRFKCKVKIENGQVRGSGAIIRWNVPPNTQEIPFSWETPFLQVEGTSKWMNISQLVKAPSQAKSAQLVLFAGQPPKTEKPTVVYFDDVYFALEKMEPGKERIYDLAGSIEKSVMLKKDKVRKFEKFPQDVKTLRLGFIPKEDFILYLGDSHGKKVPILKSELSNEKIYCLKNKKWEEVGNLYTPGSSIVLCMDLLSSSFIINKMGGHSIFYGPYEIPKGINDFSWVEIKPLSKEASLEKLYVGGPLYENFDALIQKRQREKGKMETAYDSDSQEFYIPYENLPFDLRTQPLPVPEFVRHAVMYFAHYKCSSIISNLPLLKERGFNLIALRPLPSEGWIGCGSPCSADDFYAVDPNFGSIEELMELLKEAHNLGMKVIWWLVPEHTATSNPLVLEHPEFYFRDAGVFPYWYPDCFYLDYTIPDLWRWMGKMGQYWMKFGFDGFGIESGPLLREFCRYFKRKLWEIDPDAILIGEDCGRERDKWGIDVGWGYAFTNDFINPVFTGKETPRERLKWYINEFYPEGKLKRIWTVPLGGEWSFERAIGTFGPGFVNAVTVLASTLPFLIQTQEYEEGGFTKASLKGSWAFAVKMLRLREKFPVLKAENIRLIDVDREEVWAYWKQLKGQKALVVINASSKLINASLILPSELLKDLEEKNIDIISGEKVRLDIEGEKVKLALSPYQARIFLLGK